MVLGPGHQHQALAAVRAQLRVPLRGPAPGRAARAPALVEGLQSQGVGASRQALRGEQPGDRPDAGQRRGRRAHAARDLPARLRAGGQAGAAVDRDVRLQQDQRRRTRRSTAGCSPRCCATSGASTGSWSPTGARSHDRVAALAAGLDLEMPPHLGVSDRAIVDAVADGSLDEAVLDAAVPPGAAPRRAGRAAATHGHRSTDDAHHALARRAAARVRGAAQERRRVLPLDATRAAVAVVGEFATHPALPGRGQLAGQPHPRRLAAGRAACGAAGRRGRVRRRVRDRRRPADAALADEAVRGRGRRRRRRRLPGPARLATSPRASTAPTSTCRGPDSPARPGSAATARRSSSCSPTARRSHPAAGSSTRPRCSSAGWPARPAGGAIADVLTGAANPCGRLAETIPLRLEDTPSYLNFPGEEGHVRYGEGVFVGYRGFDAAGREVAYPFGHGLSYTHLRLPRPRRAVPARGDGDLPSTVTAR